MQFSLRSLLTLVFLAALMATVFRGQEDLQARETALQRLVSMGVVHLNPAANETSIILNADSPETFLAALREVRRLPRDYSLTLRGQFDAAAWEQIAELPRIDRLSINAPPPAEAQRLPRFRSLDISVDGLSRGEFEPFVSRARVRDLTISMISIGPKRTDFDFGALRKAPSLRALRIAISLSPKQMADICTLTQLREFEFQYDDEQSGRIAQLGQLERLQALTLSAGVSSAASSPNRFTADLGELQRLPKLTRLQVNHWQLDEQKLELIGRCTNLTSLSLRYTSVEPAYLQLLQDLVHLKHLDLSGSGELGLANIPPLPALERLSLSWNPGVVNWPALDRFPRLQSLAVDDVSDQPEFLRSVIRMPHLRVIELSAWHGFPKEQLAALKRQEIRVIIEDDTPQLSVWIDALKPNGW